jgi:hypothetical protein
MKLFVTIYNDARLLGHFLRHYDGAGIGEFFLAVSPEFERAAEPFARRYHITTCTGLDVPDSVSGASAVTEMRRQYQGIDEWVVIVDLDEFIEFRKDIESTTATADRAGATVVRGIMHDRFSADGRLADFTPDSDLSAVYPVKSRFVRNIMGGCDHKGVLVKGRIKSAARAAHHRFEQERLCTEILEVSHYKWTPGAIDRLRESCRRVADAGISWAIEYKRALDHYDAHGRFAWETFGGRLAQDFELEPPDTCVDCDAPIAYGEFRFSTARFGRALCRAHQKSQQQLVETMNDPIVW